MIENCCKQIRFDFLNLKRSDRMQHNRNLTTIGFDADDTLWQNEQFFRMTEKRFVGMLADHGEETDISARFAGCREAHPCRLWLRHQGIYAVDDRDGDRGHRRSRSGFGYR